MSSPNDNSVYIFKCICHFIKDLSDSFGKNDKPLSLYAHLIERTGIMHEEPIKKHLQIFHDFVKQNDQAILNKTLPLEKTEIRYSDKVFIDLPKIFEMADATEKETIWKHLVTLLALLDPSSEAKQLLLKEKEKQKKVGSSGNEEEFLSEIVDQVGKHIDPTCSNPTDMIKDIMDSGVFSNLVDKMNSGITDGDLDLGKMMSSLHSMMGNISQMVKTTSPS